MPLFDLFAARDGNTIRETFEAEDYEAAEVKARELCAKEFRLTEELASAVAEESEWEFDSELDGFTVEPADPDPLPAYRKLADGLSDMIEEGRLTESAIPDDYQWLVAALVEIAGLDPVR
jgi:hypothetical protein